MKIFSLSSVNNLGSVLIGMISLLMTSGPGTGCGQDRGIPVLVTIRAPAENLPSAELTATLNGARFATIKPNHPTSPFVLYLPAGSSGQLDLSVAGRDRDDCISEGRTQLAVVSNHETVLEANIDIDPRVYPQCKLTVQVKGSGIVTDEAGLISCSGLTDKLCTKMIRKRESVKLRAKEGGIDSDLDEWSGACSCTSDECGLEMNGPKDVVASFHQRRCRSDGSCEAMQRTEAEPPAGWLFGPNAWWAVKNKNQVMLGSADRWNQVALLPSPAYAMWDTQNSVWIITSDRRIYSCKQGQGCKDVSPVAFAAAEPATLFSVGGSDKGSAFWAVDKRFVHRCDTASCRSEPLPPIRSEGPASKPKILTGFLRGDNVILAGQTAQACSSLGPSASCHYFMQNCTTCMAFVIPIDAPCQLGSQIPFRLEGRGDLAMWSQISERLLRLDGSSYSVVAKPKNGDCEFFPEAVQTGMLGDPKQFQVLVGRDGMISFRPVKGGCQKQNGALPGITLRAAWVSGTGDAWVVGDQGTAYSCPPTGAGCTKQPLSTTEDLVQIRQEGLRLWALSRGGSALSLK